MGPNRGKMQLPRRLKMEKYFIIAVKRRDDPPQKAFSNEKAFTIPIRLVNL
jgi:hypothetical protein